MDGLWYPSQSIQGELTMRTTDNKNLFSETLVTAKLAIVGTGVLTVSAINLINQGRYKASDTFNSVSLLEKDIAEQGMMHGLRNGVTRLDNGIKEYMAADVKIENKKTTNLG